MKNTNYIIQVPEPCHEDWNAMQPDVKGKFCSSCSKSVFDFSDKTDIEINDILLHYKDQKVCGRFKSTQINRPLNIKLDLNDLPKNMSVTRTFAVALLFVFGTFLISCTNPQGKKIDAFEIFNTSPASLFEDRLLGEAIAVEAPAAVQDTPKVIPTEIPRISDAEFYVAGGIRFVDPGFNATPDSTLADTLVEEPLMMGEIIEVTEPGDSLQVPVKDSTTLKIKSPADHALTISESPELSVYPNPTSGEFNIRYTLLKRSDVRLNIFDMNGGFVKSLVDINSQHEGNYTIPVTLAGMPNGIYIVTLIHNGKRYSEKIVLEK